MGLGFTVFLGIVGSLISGFVALSGSTPRTRTISNFGSFLIAILTSVCLLAVYERVDPSLPGGE